MDNELHIDLHMHTFVFNFITISLTSSEKPFECSKENMQTTTAELQTEAHYEKSYMNEWTKECISHLGKLKHFTKKKESCGIEKGNTESFMSFLTNSYDLVVKPNNVF